REWVIPVLELAILVGKIFEAECLEPLGHGLSVLRPQRREDPPDRHGSGGAMQRGAEIDVTRPLAKVGQAGFATPTRCPALFPFVIVGRRPSVCQLAVNGGPTAEDPCLFVLSPY